MKISIVVAMDRNRVIGRGKRLPWHLPDDLKRFKAVTMGHPVIMGRRTHESIGKPLPGRTNIVLTADPQYTAEGCVVAGSLDEGFRAAADVKEVMIIGGAAVYREALPLADRIYLTTVHAELEGDAWFPIIDWSEWDVRDEAMHGADDRHTYAFSFFILDRCRH